MPPKVEKTCLQIAVCVACMVPLLAGMAGMVYGTAFMGGGALALDSHFRYLSGLLFGIGLCFLSSVRHIERYSARFQLLTFIVVVGGLSRLVGALLTGALPHAIIFPLCMELIVTPLLCVWQNRISKRFL